MSVVGKMDQDYSDILKKNCTLYKSVTAALLLNALKCNRTRENYVGLTWMY